MKSVAITIFIVVVICLARPVSGVSLEIPVHSDNSVFSYPYQKIDFASLGVNTTLEEYDLPDIENITKEIDRLIKISEACQKCF